MYVHVSVLCERSVYDAVPLGYLLGWMWGIRPRFLSKCAPSALLHGKPHLAQVCFLPQGPPVNLKFQVWWGHLASQSCFIAHLLGLSPPPVQAAM